MPIFRPLSLLALLTPILACADTASPGPAPAAGVIQLDPFAVTGELDQARAAILPDLGATAYSITRQNIETQSQGADAPFSQILLRAPGVAEDSAANGDLHVRGEHANLQYRIDGVVLPEGISGFGLELDSRFVDSLQLITGSLPAQYGFRTAGIVDIKTRSGRLDPGGAVSLYGGSYSTLRPSVEAGGSSGNVSAYIEASFDHNQLGIENPTPSATPVHDQTDQSKVFVSVSKLIDATSRISLMGGTSDSHFQVPNTPGLDPGASPGGVPWVPGSFDSAGLNERQNEQNDYGVVAYQKSTAAVNYQLSGFGRYSSVHFMPDPVGDLYFNGVASDEARKLGSAGLQLDASDAANAENTVRSGALAIIEGVTAGSTTTVFPVDDNGDPTGLAYPIGDHHRLYGFFGGVYVQDEWRPTPQLTINYGARFDVYRSSFDRENQVSPRINLVYQPVAGTSLHLGYARYFTPPPVENVSGATVAKFNATSNAAPTDQDDPVKAERANYFDAGLAQTIGRLQLGLDGYYKQARNQLDDGLFGQTLILSAFNYDRGRVYGVEATASYTLGGFSAYANLARSEAEGKNWVSAEFLFDPADFAYVRNHWIHLDHDQRLSSSFGAARVWSRTGGSTRIYTDGICGTGLRTSLLLPDGSVIPNGGTVPSYVTFNVGAEESFLLGGRKAFAFRIDVVNLADKRYELRDGSGIGVNAAQFGERRGFFGSLSYRF